MNIALPSAQGALGFSTDHRQWVITAYALAFGSLLLLGGKLGDLFGRKWTFIAGLPVSRWPRRSAGWRSPSRCSCQPGRCRGPSRRCWHRRRCRAADGDVRGSPDRAEGVRHLRRDRRRRRVGRSAARRGAHPDAVLAMVPVRQPGDRHTDCDLRAAPVRQRSDPDDAAGVSTCPASSSPQPDCLRSSIGFSNAGDATPGRRREPRSS